MNLLFLATTAWAHIPVVWITTPDEDWCSVINGVEGGDVIMFIGGDYYGPCDVVAQAPLIGGEITIIESLDPQDPAVFHNGGGAYILSLDGPSVTVMLMRFTEVPEGTSALSIRGGEEMAVRFNTFEDMSGNAVSVVGAVTGLLVNDNDVRNIGGAAFSLCPEGNCAVEDADIHENLIDGAGSGVVFGVGSWGAVTDNTLAGVSGTGVSVAGGVSDTTVSQNFIQAEGSALWVDGRVDVQSNIALGAPALDASGTSSVQVRGNTLVGDVDLVGWGGEGQAFTNNAVVGSLPAPGGALVGGNVDCTDVEACFYDAAGWDFYPVPQSELRTAGESLGEALGSDWCGRARSEPQTVGALEAASVLSFGPIERVQKDDFFCVLPDDPPVETSTPTDSTPTDSGLETEDPVRKKKRRSASSCGCETPGGGGGWLGVLLAGLVLLRRRGLALALLMPGVASAHVGQIFTIGPDEAWCEFINEEVLPGDLIFLLPGEYEGPCTWNAREPTELGETNMLQSTDANNPAILTAPEGSDFILSVTGTRVGLLHLSFQDTAPASAALQLDQVSDVDVRFAHFLNLEGDAIRVTDATEVWIADSEFRDVGGVSVTLGCEEAVCAVPNARITDLLIDGSERGVWVHEGSSASIEEGVFANLGQEALAYGGDLGRVGGNLFWAPVIVGGAAQVHNNIFVSGLTVDTEAVGAELLGNAILGGLTVTRTPTTWTILGNAVEGEAWAEGNVACAVPSDCWEDAEGGDFRPVSALLEPGVDSGLLTDFCGSTRVSPHAMGALERTETGAPLGVQFKKLQICTVPDFVPQDPEPRTRRRTSAKSCGCEVTPTPAMLSGLFVFGVALVGVRIK